MFFKLISLIGLASVIFGLCGCIPPVYVFDKATVFEKEASGEYPIIEANMLEKTLGKGPIMINPDDVDAYEKKNASSNINKEKIYRIVNGEYLVFEENKTK